MSTHWHLCLREGNREIKRVVQSGHKKPVLHNYIIGQISHDFCPDSYGPVPNRAFLFLKDRRGRVGTKRGKKAKIKLDEKRRTITRPFARVDHKGSGLPCRIPWLPTPG